MNRFPMARMPLGNEELRNFFERFFQPENEGDQSVITTTQWAPRVDIQERPDAFVISADIPGVDPQQIEIHMENGMLSIRGERQWETSQEGSSFSRRERQYGSFYRRFALPDTADAEGIEARGSNGVLEITIPKKPETKPRRIEVR